MAFYSKRSPATSRGLQNDDEIEASLARNWNLRFRSVPVRVITPGLNPNFDLNRSSLYEFVLTDQHLGWEVPMAR